MCNRSANEFCSDLAGAEGVQAPSGHPSYEPATIWHRRYAAHVIDFDADVAAEALLTAKPVLLGKLRVACDVDAAGAKRGVREVLRFLALTGMADGGLTPSPRVDDAWHEVILCTREYAALCQRYFGRFVHHDPGGSDELNHRRFHDTLRLYNLHFGPPDPAWWGKAAALAPQADCGACEAPPP